MCFFVRKHYYGCIQFHSAPQGLVIGTPKSRYASYSAMLHSNTSKEQREKHFCNPSSHYEKYKKIHLWHSCPISQCMKALTSKFQLYVVLVSFHYKQKNSIKSTFAIFISRTQAIMHPPQIISYMRLWKKWGHKGVKVTSRCKQCSCCSWWKGASQDEVTLISEEIKSAALAIFELCLSEGISKSISQ